MQLSFKSSIYGSIKHTRHYLTLHGKDINKSLKTGAMDTKRVTKVNAVWCRLIPLGKGEKYFLAIS